MEQDDPYGFSEHERRMILNYCKINGVNLDPGIIRLQLQNLNNQDGTDPHPIEIVDFPPEKQIAAHIYKKRNIDTITRNIEFNPPEGFLDFIGRQFVMVEDGYGLITDFLNEYWIIEPTVEKVLSLESQEFEPASRLEFTFRESDHSIISRKHTTYVMRQLPDWDPYGETADNVEKGIEIFNRVPKICERGFPFLLGIKRILDGEEIDLNRLQKKRASSVRRELIDSGTHPNSVYFDLMIKKYNDSFRNAMAHGDVMHDPIASEVSIPNQDISYCYKEFNETARKNFSIAIFVGGMVQSLVAVSLAINDPENDLKRDLLPF